MLRGVAKVGAAGIGAFGAMKLLHNELMMAEFDTFGYPRGFEYCVGIWEIVAAVGLIQRKMWGGTNLLLVAGGGASSVILRSKDENCPEICRNVELAWVCAFL